MLFEIILRANYRNKRALVCELRHRSKEVKKTKKRFEIGSVYSYYLQTG